MGSINNVGRSGVANTAWFESACATLDKLICYEAGLEFGLLDENKTINLTSTRTAQLAGIVHAGYSALENSNELQQDLFRVSEDISRHLSEIRRRVKNLHKVITGESSDSGCDSESEYPSTQAGKALQDLNAARDSISTISALIEEIEQQAWVAGADTPKGGVHISGAMPLSVCPHRIIMDWAEVLNQRERENKAFRENRSRLSGMDGKVAPFDNDSQ
ncbi:hypothetical protein LLQ46_00425 [Rouxiella badensis]|uniref:hypothetical protein n=1 Tax=Rouxiella badensis TaxID=1646377 RepID=UPI001D159CE2|nr:hypothetical protein [Rouxiella badensis]MCC3745313.1 hypothetical protein [Rouxiella badensis]